MPMPCSEACRLDWLTGLIAHADHHSLPNAGGNRLPQPSTRTCSVTLPRLASRFAPQPHSSAPDWQTPRRHRCRPGQPGPGNSAATSCRSQFDTLLMHSLPSLPTCLADAMIALLQSRPITSSISRFTRSGSAPVERQTAICFSISSAVGICCTVQGNSGTKSPLDPRGWAPRLSAAMEHGSMGSKGCRSQRVGSSGMATWPDNLQNHHPTNKTTPTHQPTHPAGQSC